MRRWWVGSGNCAMAESRMNLLMPHVHVANLDLFYAEKGQGEPSQFVFTAPREVVVDVPFTFKDVPLP